MTKLLELLLLPIVILALAYWLAEDWLRGRPLGSMEI